MRLLPLAVLLVLGSVSAATAQNKLSPENLLALQDALVWTGDYDGPLDGKLAGETAEALKRFQEREGLTASGRATATDMRRLFEISLAAKRDAQWSLAIDGPNDLVVFVPRALLPETSRAADGRVFSSVDGRARLTTFKASNISAVHSTARSGAGTLRREELKDGRSLVIGQQGEQAFVQFASGTKGRVKGVKFSYPAAESERYARIARAVVNGFVADPAAPVRKKAKRPEPSFMGAFRLPDNARLYPYAVADLENRDAQVALGPVTARVVATKPFMVEATSAGRKNPKRDPNAGSQFAPRLEIDVDGVRALDVTDPAWNTFFAELRAVELDPANGYPEVLLTTYTGGAHCCTLLTIYTARADGSWLRVDGGSYDGSPDFPQDLDGDGRYELVAPDNRFLNAFGCYACSATPDEIRRLDDGRLIDISTFPTYRDDHAARLQELWRRARTSGTISTNGFLAGFVGAARRAGEGEDAWTFALAHVDPKNQTGVKNRDFPQSLAEFLRSAGY